MTTRKGILLPEYEVFISEAVWDLVKDHKPKWLPKWISMQGVNLVVKSIDNLILDKMPAKLKATFIPFVDAAFKGKIEEMRRLFTDVIAGLVDWRGVSKDTQLYVYDSGTRLITSVTMAFAEKIASKKADEALYG
jgi:hypothetical protein